MVTVLKADVGTYPTDAGRNEAGLPRGNTKDVGGTATCLPPRKPRNESTVAL